MIIIVEKRGQLLKGFKESQEFFETVGLSRSTIYFKMNLYKFFSKYPVVKSPTLPPNYFKNTFKMIMKVLQEHVDLFGKKDK